MKRYLRNKNMITDEEQKILGNKRVIVLGCGGLGGYVIEMLARLGIGGLILVDFDTFDETNLNRQILSTGNNIGASKVLEAVKRVNIINLDVSVVGVEREIAEDNLEELILCSDIVVDALDSIPLKIAVERVCSKADKTLIHGAVGGWVAQVAVIRPGEGLLSKFYEDIEIGIEKELGNPSFTPAAAASIQVAEVVKVLLGKEEVLNREILYIDLLNNDFTKRLL